MKKIAVLFTIVLSLGSLSLFGQESTGGKIMLTNTPEGNSVKIKWVEFPTFYSLEGMNLYRRVVGTEEWNKVNNQLIQKRDFMRLADEEKTDMSKLLEEELNLSTPDEIDELMILMIAMEFFQYEAFAEYIGGFYHDKTVDLGKEYEYKVTKLEGDEEKIIAVSPSIKVEKFQSIKGIKDPQIYVDARVDSLVKIVWKPETERYFGVNVWRTDLSTNERSKLNENIILPTDYGNDKEGNPILPDAYFSAADHEIGKTYRFEVEAIDFFGQGSMLTEPVDIEIIDRTPPPLPLDITLTKAGIREVSLDWVVAGTDILKGFNIYARKNTEDYLKINDELLSPITTQFTHNIQEFGSYFYKIESVSTYGITDTTNLKAIDVLDVEPPIIPVNMQVQPDTGKIHISWNANSESDLQGYIVFRSIRADKNVPFERVTPRPIKEPIFTDKLSKRAKNTFYYKVCAIDTSFNMSGFTEPQGVQMPDIIPPHAPVLIKAIPAKDKVTLEWLPVLLQDDDLAGYEVFRRNITENEDWQSLSNGLLADSIVTFIDLTAKLDNKYEYQLQAADDTGNLSEFSNSYKVQMKPDKTPVDGASKITADYQKKKKQVTVKWKGEETDRRGSMVFRQTGAGKLVPVSPMLSEKAVFVDKKVKPGNTYTYLVKTYYNNGKIGKSTPEELVIEAEKEKKE